MKEECEVLSLDLWDTIIKRDCYPDEIKAMTAEYLYIYYQDKLKNPNESVYSLMKSRIECEILLGKRAKLQGLDNEYFIKDVFELWISEKTNLENKEAVVDELYTIELDNELEHTYLDPKIVDTINQYSYKKLVCISDFYAGTEFIDIILKKNKFPYEFDYKFISCEWNYNKGTGKLFDLVQERLKIEPFQQIHIGDNKYSDFKIPDSKGIRSVHYICNQNDKEYNCSIYKKQCVSLREIPKIQQCTLSPFFYGFISWISEQCLKYKIEKIYFFTREGEFYKKLYDALRKSSIYQGRLPEADILEVSRMATFLPSLNKCTLDEMMKLWNQYSCQSMKTFFKSLTLPYEEAQQFLERYNIDGEKRINQPWKEKVIQSLFKDDEFIDFVEHHANDKKNMLITYFEEKGITKNSEKVAIVDIGWRGTIQDNLCYIYKDTQWIGLYMGLMPFLNKQPKNAIKLGYLNEYEGYSNLLRISTPFEMICNSPNGSVYGYEDEKGKIKPIRKKEELEDVIYYEYTQKIQEEITDDLEQLSGWAKYKYVLSWQFKQIAYKGIEKFAFYPTRACVNAYFKLRHNEEFGMGIYLDKNVPNKLPLFILSIFSVKKRMQMKKFLGDTTWPQGYFVRYCLYPLLWLYNWKIKSKIVN